MTTNALVLQIYDSVTQSWFGVYTDEKLEISIEETSPIWGNSSGMFSYPIKLNVERNRHILGTIDQMHGSDIYKSLRGRRFRLYVCGLLFREGIVQLDKEVNISDGVIEIELASNERELSDILEGVSCRDIPADDGTHKIQIGYALKREKEMEFNFLVEKQKFVTGGTGSSSGGAYIPESKTAYEGNPVKLRVVMPKVMVPKYYDTDYSSAEDFVNVQNAYDPKKPWKYPYCNVRVCTQKYSQTSSGWEKERGYSVGEPDRVNSAPCFFVPYFMYMLWNTKGIDVCVKENQLEDIEDYRRLAMFHTNCGYDEVYVDGSTLFHSSEKNKAKVSYFIEKKGNYITYLDEYSTDGWGRKIRKRAEYKFSQGVYSTTAMPLKGGKWVTPSTRAGLYAAYANSNNFPDADVTQLLECIESAFGARLLFDSSGRTLRIVLLRNILEDTDIETINAHVVKVYTEHSDVRGFRLKYNSSSEIYKNSITGERVIIGTKEDKNGSNVDTTYNYNDFRNIKFTNDYSWVVRNVSPYDSATFLDTVTGNAYRIKVDKNASTEEELYPSLFEVGGYGDVEIGDCSNNDYVSEVSINFNPVIPNDVNYEAERNALSEEKYEEIKPKYAQYVDAEVHHVVKNGQDVLSTTENAYDTTLLRMESYASDSYSDNTKAYKNFKVCVHLKFEAVESYDISGDSDSPYETEQSGFTLGFMRGSGADAQYAIAGNDEEGNELWVVIPGTNSAFTSDSITSDGETFDYNGTEPGDSDIDISSGIYDSKGKSAIALLNSAFSTSLSYNREHLYLGSNIRVLYKNFYYSYDRIYVEPVRLFHCAYLSRTFLILNPGDYSSRRAEYSKILSDVLAYAETESDAKRMLGGLYIASYDYLSSEADNAMSKWISYSDLGVFGVERISLKLKAEKKNPYHGASESNPKFGKTSDPYKDKTDQDGYFTASGSLSKQRGIYDRFYKLYSLWLMERKKAYIEVETEIAELINIDFARKYRIGDIVGFINKISYTVSSEGVSNVVIEMYYL